MTPPELIEENRRLREALERIANDPHCDYDYSHTPGANLSYATGVTDGHRCAANKARAALTGSDK
jgi:hypothetical protein